MSDNLGGTGKEGSKDFIGGLKVIREDMELKTDSRMLNPSLGFDDETYTSMQFNNSSQKPNYNHSVITKNTRESVVLLNLDHDNELERSEKGS